MFASPEFAMSDMDVPTQSTLSANQCECTIMGVVGRKPPQSVAAIDRVFACDLNRLGGDAFSALHLTHSLEPPHRPMLRHVAEPVDAGGLEGDVGVEAAGDGMVDDGLLLLLQQGDELALGVDVAADAPVGVVQVADDGGLLWEGWDQSGYPFQVRPIQVSLYGANTLGANDVLLHH